MYLYRYRYDKNGVYEMSNPNLEPPKTISYEMGLAYEMFNNIIFTASGYYKDVSGQTGDINYINSSGTVDYDRWDNNNYQDIEGLEINITKNDNSWITGWFNFNYMLRKSGYTGRATISDATIDEELVGLYQASESRFLPKPILNTNITFSTPSSFSSNSFLDALLSNFRITIFAEWTAGDYFTYDPLQKKTINSNMQWPDYFMTDLRLGKTFNLFGLTTTLFLDVSNILNIKVNWMNQGYAFRRDASDTGNFTEWKDTQNYLKSLHLPMYNSPEFEQLRLQEPGKYIAGDDRPGDLNSAEKPYIDNPDYTYFIYGQPRDVWFGLRIDF
jgi:hypothetical protein